MNNAIILAAGKGTRMHTELPKCAFPFMGKPMIEYIVEALEKISMDQIICVVGHKKEVLMDLLKLRVHYAIQDQQLGTGHAVRCAKEYIKPGGYTIILPGDTPLIDTTILKQMIHAHIDNKNDITIGTIFLDNPFGFGRIVRNQEGNIIQIIEEKDATKEQKAINEINTGLFCVDNALLLEAVDKINNKNAKREYYLTDIVQILAEQAKIGSFTIQEAYKLNGVNDLYTLSCVERDYRNAILKQHMLNGVNIINPDSTTIEKDVVIESGTIIHPNCYLRGKTKIGKNCMIGPNTELYNAELEEEVTCNHSVVYESKIKKGARVGPFAHLRMNTIIGEKNRIGNFVEIKNSSIGQLTNVSHLTYLGDTSCGSQVNWGCGCVTVNYDGKDKFKTVVGDRVFIGCNSNLIAPIEIKSDSFIAAGSTITDNLSVGDFAIARAHQTTKKGYASKYGYKKNK